MNFGTFSEALVSLWSGSIHTGALSREQGPGKSQAWSSASKILVLLDCLYLVSLWSCGYSLAQPEIPVSAIYTPIFSKVEIELLNSQHLRSMWCQSLTLLCILSQDVADKERVSPLNANFPQRRSDDKFCHPKSSVIQNRKKGLPPCVSCSCLFAAFSDAEIILHGYEAHLNLCRVKTAEIF